MYADAIAKVIMRTEGTFYADIQLLITGNVIGIQLIQYGGRQLTELLFTRNSSYRSSSPPLFSLSFCCIPMLLTTG
jgi:hypothetical protein